MPTCSKVQFPGPGCIVEFLHGNSTHLAFVLENSNSRLRLYTQTKKEIKLPLARILPWFGPEYPAPLTLEEMDNLLIKHKEQREVLGNELNLDEIWQLAEGEIISASAQWFAGLAWKHHGIDHEAAMGHALLTCKTHFRFTPPDFEIYSSEIAEKRVEELARAKAKEEITLTGNTFFHKLWNIYTKKEQLVAKDLPPEHIALPLQEALREYIANPDAADEGLWKNLTRGLPAEQHLALFLATAWGIIPQHYNFMLDRVGYAAGTEWATEFADELASLKKELESQGNYPLDHVVANLPFVTVDPKSTLDRDDAFHIEHHEDGGYTLYVAVSCPTLAWHFGNELDKAVLRRTTSLYLPEATLHMLPEELSCSFFSLQATKNTLSLIIQVAIDANGHCTDCTPIISPITVVENLHLEEAEAIITDQKSSSPYKQLFDKALTLAQLIQQNRVQSGAVIIIRPDTDVFLDTSEDEPIVQVEQAPQTDYANCIVGEIMVFANTALAAWCREREIPLLYRIQDVALPKEFFGIWSTPQDIAKIVRSLPPAGLADTPKRHAGLGVQGYATFTSPIRRYVDFFNQGQVVTYLRDNYPRCDKNETKNIIPLLQSRIEAVSQIQRFRPRYWKLLFFKQQGDKKWWQGIIADENDAFVTVALPWAQIVVRGKRKLFGDKTVPGLEVMVRLGKINPLGNEITILEAMEA